MNGLENIAAGSIENITISGNSALSECNVQCICNHLLSLNGTLTVENNAAGCNSIEEVEDACESVGINKQQSYPLTIHPNPTDNGSITLTLENPKSLFLACFNTFGQQVHRQEVTGTETVIDLRAWSPGIYLVVVYEEGRPLGQAKFVVR